MDLAPFLFELASDDRLGILIGVAERPANMHRSPADST